MSSKIRINRICQMCGIEFVAKTTVTKNCSDRCAKAAYKARKRNKAIELSNLETAKTKAIPITEVNAKEILTVKEVSLLLGCSIRTTYRMINNRTIKATNLSDRMTRVLRSDLDDVFNGVPQHPIEELKK